MRTQNLWVENWTLSRAWTFSLVVKNRTDFHPCFMFLWAKRWSRNKFPYGTIQREGGNGAIGRLWLFWFALRFCMAKLYSLEVFRTIGQQLFVEQCLVSQCKVFIPYLIHKSILRKFFSLRPFWLVRTPYAAKRCRGGFGHGKICSAVYRRYQQLLADCGMDSNTD